MKNVRGLGLAAVRCVTVQVTKGGLVYILYVQNCLGE